MSTQQASSTGVLRAAEVLDLTISQAKEAGRNDLVRRLSDARRLLVDSCITVHIVGGSQQGKSSLLEALIAPSGEMAVGAPAGRPVLVESGGASTGSTAAGEGGIGRAHAVLFVSDASSELTRTEIEDLRRIQDLCPTIIFVLTKIDAYARWRQVLQRDQTLLRDAGIGVEAVAVSAALRMHSLRSGGDDLAQISGVAALLGQVERITADAERTSLRAVAHHTLSVLDELKEMLRFRRSRLVLPGRADLARTEARLAEERIDSLHSRSARWQTMLYDSFATVHSDVDFDMQQRMRAVLTDAEHTIEQGDPAKNFDELTTWLRQRLAHEARANHDLTVTSARTVSLRAAEHFSLSEMHIIDPPLARIPTDLPTALYADQVVSGTRVGLSAGMNIFLRAYIGFVMFFLLTVLTGVALPLVIGLAPALLMGGLAVIEERKRQIDQRRAQASTTVRNYVTDFSMWVTKDSRNLLRQLEQQLRDAYAALVEQMLSALQEARSLALGTLAEQEQSPTLLAQVDTDLALLAGLRGRAAAIIPAELLDLPHATLCRVG